MSKKEFKESKRETSFKPNNKDIGACLRINGGQHVHRSKFKNDKDAQEELNKLLGLNVTNPLYEVYKCPICYNWHFGLKEWQNKFENE